MSDIFIVLQSVSILNIVWASLIAVGMGIAGWIMLRRYRETSSTLTYRQKNLCLQVLVGILISFLWGVCIFVHSLSILVSSCPFFRTIDFALILISNILGDAIIFIFHWAAIDHILSSDPTKQLSEVNKLIYLPSVMVVCTEICLHVSRTAIVDTDENPYRTSSARSLACAEISASTFTCALTFSRNLLNINLALFVFQTVSVTMIIMYCVTAWKRLSHQPWHSQRSLNISLRLFVWNTLVVGGVYYGLKITHFAVTPKKGMNRMNSSDPTSSNPCSYLLLNLTASPEIFQLFAVWMLSRGYLFTPVPSGWRSRPYYKLRTTMLQTFAWNGGGKDTQVNTEVFWGDVLGDERVNKTRKARAEMLRKMKRRHRSVGGGLRGSKKYLRARLGRGSWRRGILPGLKNRLRTLC